MTARRLEGRPVAARIREQVAEDIRDVVSQGSEPGLAVVLGGNDPAAAVYARQLDRQGTALGIRAEVLSLPLESSEAEVDGLIDRLNNRQTLDGIVVATPLPPQIALSRLSGRLDPAKDVDGMTVVNSGRLYLGLPASVPSTAMAILELLVSAGVEIQGKEAVVVGRSPTVGKPVAMLLLRSGATVTVTHTQTRDLAKHTGKADILVVAAGRPGLISGSMIRPGAVVIDAGINVVGERIVGDVDFEGAAEVAGAITPVPGGVGPLTNIMLFRAVAQNFRRRMGHG